MNKQRFELQFDARMNVEQIKTAASQMEAAFSKIKLPGNLGSALTTTFAKLKTELANFDDITSKTFTSMADVNKATKSYDSILSYFEKMKVEMAKVKGLDPEKFLPKATLDKLKNLNNQLGKISSAAKANQAAIEKETKAYQDQMAVVDKLEQEIKAKEAALNSNRGKKGANAKRMGEIETDLAQKKASAASMKTSAKAAGKNIEEDVDYQALQVQIKNLTTEYNNLFRANNKLSESLRTGKLEIDQLRAKQQEAETTAQGLKTNLENLSKVKPDGLQQIRAEIAQLKGVSIDQVTTDVTELAQEIQNIPKEKFSELAQHIMTADAAMDGLGQELSEGKQKVREFADAGSDLNDMSKQIDQLRDQMTQFFSVSNGWNLLRRTIQQAYDAVKEYDAAMTEIAVVSDYSIGDVWSMVGDYAEQASKLGASTMDVINAQKLYIQQGLDMTEANEIATDTIKMARIANIDGAKATELMTAAIRGFNLEMSESSRVNDVFSELAAKTAADTQQIAVALSKTASIANSAGASLENTSAFLAQIIETTQEAPETAGTALKTIIARFQELKKPMSEIGEVDGEVVDANKIESALREAGVALRDTNGEFRNFDDVILELAGRWDSLDVMTQRYIATMAAGSRQQSRFLALMSDSKRLTELSSIAMNSAGSSQKQFDKTMESLTAKINQLSVEWERFITSLTNNEILKTGIDLLAQFLSTINGITEGLRESGTLGSAFASVINVIIAAVGFKLVSGLVTSVIGKVAAVMGAEGQQSGAIFANGFRKAILGTDLAPLGIKKAKEFATALNKEGGRSGLNIADFIDTNKGKIPQKDLKKFTDSITKSLTNDFKQKVNFGELTGEELNTANAALTKFENEMKEVAQGAGSAKDAVNGLQESMKSLGVNTKETGLTLDESFADKGQRVISTLSSGFMGVGVALNTVSLAADELGANEGLTNFLSTAGTIAMTVGSILPLLNLLQKGVLTLSAKVVAGGISGAAAWGWAAVIAAIIVGIIAIGAMVANAIETDAEKTKRLTEEANRAQAAAEAANKSYNDLLSAKSSFDDLQKQLAELEKGTDEWNKKMRESNLQVLDLLEKYPELQEYVKRGAEGQLIIDDKGWEAAEDAALEKVAKTQAVSIAANSRLAYQKNQTSDSAKTMKDALGGEQNLEKLYNRFLEDSDFFEDNGAMEKFSKETGVAVDAIKDLKDELVEYTNAAEARIDAEALGYENALLSMVDSETAINSDFEDKIAQGMGRYMTTHAYKDSIDMTIGDADFHQLREELNVANDSASDGGDKEVREMYMKMTGAKAEDIEAMSKDELMQAIEDMQGLEKQQELMEKAIGKFDTLAKTDKAQASAISKIMDETQNFSAKELEQFKGKSSDEILKEISSVLGLSEDQLAQLGITTDAIYNEIRDTEYDEKQYDRLKKSLKPDGSAQSLLEKFKDQNLGFKDLQSIARQLIDMDARGGDSENFSSKIIELMNGLSILEQEKAWKILQTTDFANGESIQNFVAQLESITGKDFSDLTIELNNISQAAASFSMDAIREEIEKTQSLISKLVGAINFENITFSLEEMQTLLNSGYKIGEFIYDRASNSYSYAGKDAPSEVANKLVTDSTKLAIGQLTSAGDAYKKAKEKTPEYQDAVDAATRAETNYNNAMKGGFQKNVGTVNSGLSETITYKDFLSRYTGEGAINFIVQDETAGYKDLYGYETQYRYASGAAVANNNAVETTAWENTYHVNNLKMMQDDMLEILGMSAEDFEAELGKDKTYQNRFKKLAELLEEHELELSDTTKQAKITLATNKAALESGGILANNVEEAMKAFKDVPSMARGLMKFNVKELRDPARTKNLFSQLDDLYEQGIIDAYESAEVKEALRDAISQAFQSSLLEAGFSKEEAEEYDAQRKQIEAKIAYYTRAGRQDEVKYWENKGTQLDQQIANESRRRLSSKGVKEAQTTWNDNKENLRSGNAYDKAMAQENMKRQIKDIFGMRVDDAFFESEANLKDLEAALDGSYDAYKRLYDKIHDTSDEIWSQALASGKYGEEEVKKTIQETRDQGKRIVELQEKKKNGSLTDKESEELDRLKGEFAENLAKIRWMLENNNYTAEQIAKYMPQILGPEINVTYETVVAGGDGSTKNTFWEGGEQRNSGIKKSTVEVTGGNGQYDPSVYAELFGNGIGGGDSDTPWESSYDYLHNMVQETNKLLRGRNKLEREYTKLLEKEGASAQDLYENSQKQLQNLAKQKEYYDKQKAGRENKLQEYINEYADVREYVYIEDGMVKLYQDKLEELSGQDGNNELGERIDEAFDKMTEAVEQIEEVEDSLDEIDDTTKEIKKTGKDNAIALEGRIKDALVQKIQEEIDAQQEVSEAISTANSEMLDRLQTNLEEYRSQRDMEEKAEDISDMEGRLALLRSTNADPTEILKLEEELAKSRQDYTDSLIDKSIDEMTKQNEEAQKQREKQIELQQLQLEENQKNGEIARQANEIFSAMLRGDTESLRVLLKETDNFAGMTATEQKDWEETFQEQYADAGNYWLNNNNLKDLGYQAGQSVSFYGKNGTYTEGTVSSDGKYVINKDRTKKWAIENIYRDSTGAFRTNVQSEAYQQPTQSRPASSEPETKLITNGSRVRLTNNKYTTYASGYTSVAGTLGVGVGYEDTVQQLSGNGKAALLKNIQSWVRLQDLEAFATGGLADFTGPAWLDGTKSRPEYVLNASQTQGFLGLVNILESLKSNKTEAPRGDNYYSIDIHVDELGNDYDVDQLIERIKENIEEDAAYRNVNAVDFGRR